MLKILIISVLINMLCVSVSFASTYPSLPTIAAIKREMARMRSQAVKLNSIRPSASAGIQASNAFNTINTGGQGVEVMPKVNMSQIKSGNISSLIDKYARNMNKTMIKRVPTGLYVFLSFSIPNALMRSYFKQAEKAKCTIVFNGFKDNSIKDTVLYLAHKGGLTSQSTTSIIIDPTQFTRYNVTRVPTFVLTHKVDIPVQQCSAATGCQYKAIPNTKLEGAVSIRYALSEMEKQDPSVTKYAQKYINNIDRPN